jgi:signal-transduction protein with cAMP-binding, CBS, and nucleotidyltransferase domain
LPTDGRGDVHDAACLPDSLERQWSGRAVEDTLLYGLPQADLEKLWGDHPKLRQQAFSDLGQRLRQARRGAGLPIERDLGSLPLATLVARSPVCARATETIREAAMRMTRERVSALLVWSTEGDSAASSPTATCAAAVLPSASPTTRRCRRS